MTDQATLDKLEAGFKKLQEASDCKSLLKKHLTKEVFDACKTRKTAMGATLLDVIQSGMYKKYTHDKQPPIIVILSLSSFEKGRGERKRIQISNRVGERVRRMMSSTCP